MAISKRRFAASLASLTGYFHSDPILTLTPYLRTAKMTGGGHHFDPRWLGTSIPIDHWHFHRQLLHRYRIVLAPGDFSAIVAAIRDGRARLIERQVNRRAIYSVRVPSVGDRVFVLVSGARNVVTVLRPTRRLKGKRRVLL